MSKKWNNPGRKTKFNSFYESWLNMLKRSNNKDKIHPTYSDVIVCERWLSYDNFFEDMADTWFKGATLDKDSILPGNKVYCKEYCKWITRSENCKEMIDRIGSPMKKENVAAKFKGGKNPRARKVQCIETGEIYDCSKDASLKLNLSKDSVSKAANPNNRLKTAGGYHWEYVEE